MDIFLQNNISYLNRQRSSFKCRLLFVMYPRLNRLYRRFLTENDPERKNYACAQVLDAIEETIFWKLLKKAKCLREDIRVWRQQTGQRNVIDHSGKKKKDYYSICVIVKNEARFIREYILFYRATGADRIYLYDNESTDNLLEEIEPFLKIGVVVYRYWPGRVVQTAAYRHAIRHTKHNTKWLAIVDADEFLFSPKGMMPDQLRQYEQYAAVGVNWIMYGPNGHTRRPEGLVMDQYTTTFADRDCLGNCHIKSILQPKKVSCMYQIHFAIYRGRQYAVDETGTIIDHQNAYVPGAGRAFTAVNHRSVFRINHYLTKSLEDLKEKCSRGYPDGTPNKDYKQYVHAFDTQLIQDFAINPFAEAVRTFFRKVEERREEDMK